jgi:hypothetical protein
MIAEYVVGPRKGGDGSTFEGRVDQTGASVVQLAHARYQEAVLRGNVWLACAQAGIAVTNLNATATGFILSNPAGSGRYLVLLEIGLLQTSTATTTANAGIVLAANVNPVAAAVIHTTPLTVRNALLGASGTSVGLADSSATLPAAPVAIRSIWQPSVSATATTAIPPYILDKVEGAVILAPGTSVSLSALSAISVLAHMAWEEIQFTP